MAITMNENKMVVAVEKSQNGARRKENMQCSAEYVVSPKVTMRAVDRKRTALEDIVKAWIQRDFASRQVGGKKRVEESIFIPRADALIKGMVFCQFKGRSSARVTPRLMSHERALMLPLPFRVVFHLN
jgi:hypothetical protein